jgi:hypothetical protein
VNAIATLVNLGCCVAAFYFGHAGYPWYWVGGLAVLSAVISPETDANTSLSQRVRGWLLVGVLIGSFYLVIYFAGRLLW